MRIWLFWAGHHNTTGIAFILLQVLKVRSHHCLELYKGDSYQCLSSLHKIKQLVHQMSTQDANRHLVKSFCALVNPYCHVFKAGSFSSGIYQVKISVAGRICLLSVTKICTVVKLHISILSGNTDDTFAVVSPTVARVYETECWCCGARDADVVARETLVL